LSLIRVYSGDSWAIFFIRQRPDFPHQSILASFGVFGGSSSVAGAALGDPRLKFPTVATPKLRATTPGCRQQGDRNRLRDSDFDRGYRSSYAPHFRNKKTAAKVYLCRGYELLGFWLPTWTRGGLGLAKG
jgi:hypothetical protein